MGAVKKYVADIYKAVSSTVIGMGVTGRTALKRPITLEYPDVRWQLPERYRGILHNRIEDCIGCLACARACPVNCIHIEISKREKDEYGVTSDGTKITQWIPLFDIDMALCMVCGLCTEVCPTECLTMTKEYELAVQNKQDMYLEFALDRDKEIVKRKMAAKEAAAREATGEAAASGAASQSAAAAPGKEASAAPASAAAPARPEGQVPAAQGPAGTAPSAPTKHSDSEPPAAQE